MIGKIVDRFMGALLAVAVWTFLSFAVSALISAVAAAWR